MDKELNTTRDPAEELRSQDPETPTLRPYPDWKGQPLNHDQCHKVLKVLSVCDQDQKVDALCALATSVDGLVDDEVRSKTWPILLGYQPEVISSADAHASWRDLPSHKDEDQVELDVNRSFVYYPKNDSDTELDRRKQQLSNVITEVLRRHPMLSYFQGFHDIVQVFLLVLGVDRASEAVAHLSLLRIRDFMLPSLSPSLAHLNLIPMILDTADPDLCRHLSTTQPFFALSATLTLYAHDIQEYGDIARLFDFFIAQPAVVSVYFFAVIVLSRREEVFNIPAEEPEMLHSVLSKLPKPLNLEVLISRTMILFKQHPPEHLPRRAWSKVSCYSVLKTTRSASRYQTLADGEEFFSMQTLQINREELRKRTVQRIWKYRRPMGGIGLAVAIGVASIWLRRNGVDRTLGLGVQKLYESIRALM